MKCTSCGNEMPDNASFCIKCGGKLDASGWRPESGGRAVPSQFQPGTGAPGTAPAAQRDFKIQPLGLGQLFDTGIKIYFRHFKFVVGAAAIVLIPFHLVFFLIFKMMFENPADLENVNIVVMISFVLLTIIMMPLIQGATIKVISDVYMGETVSVKKAYAFAARKIGALILGGIIFGILVGIGTILLIIPGIYLMVAFYLFPYAIVLENKSSTQSLSRSQQLVKGSWFKLFLVILLMGVLTWVIQAIVQVPWEMYVRSSDDILTVIRLMPVVQLIQNILQLLIYPIGIIISILFYYDLRVRKEGYDLEIMAREILE